MKATKFLICIALLFGFNFHIMFAHDEDILEQKMKRLQKLIIYNYYGSHRKPVFIKNPNEEIDHCQVKITVDFVPGKMSLDFSNIRFVDANQLEFLSYWMMPQYTGETKNGEKATFWVKIPRVQNGKTQLYVYYGNPTLLSQSKGDNVFMFFDDFSQKNKHKWQGKPEIKHDEGKLKMKFTRGSGYKDQVVYTKFDLPSSYTVESFINDIPKPNSNFPGGLIISFQDQDNWLAVEGAVRRNEWAIRGETDGTDTGWNLGSYKPNIFLNGPHIQGLNINKGEFSIYVKNQHQATKIMPDNHQYSSTAVGFVKHTGTGSLEASYIFVRKFLSEGITVTLGDEENVID